jgi:hypothetical protein
MIALIFLIAAFVCFVIAAFWGSARVNLVAAGLGLWLFAVALLPLLIRA